MVYWCVVQEHDVIHRHMAILVSICADMDAIALYTTLQFETGTSDTEFYEQMLQPLPDSFSRVLSTSPLALVLTVHLAARTAKRGCSKSLQRLIHSLSTCKLTSKIPCTVWYYFLLEVSKLSKFVLTENVMDSLGSNLLALFIFEGLIVPLCLNQRNCLGHCLRLLTVWPPSARTAVASAADESWFEILRPNDQVSMLSLLVDGGTVFSSFFLPDMQSVYSTKTGIFSILQFCHINFSTVI